jgi:hypothetical protein
MVKGSFSYFEFVFPWINLISVFFSYFPYRYNIYILSLLNSVFIFFYLQPFSIFCKFLRSVILRLVSFYLQSFYIRSFCVRSFYFRSFYVRSFYVPSFYVRSRFPEILGKSSQNVERRKIFPWFRNITIRNYENLLWGCRAKPSFDR